MTGGVAKSGISSSFNIYLDKQDELETQANFMDSRELDILIEFSKKLIFHKYQRGVAFVEKKQFNFQQTLAHPSPPLLNEDTIDSSC